MRGLPDRWEASWPKDRHALATAIAVTAGFPRLVGPMHVRLTGNAHEALSGLVADLGSAGLPEERLPDVSLDPATAAGDGPHISMLAPNLAAVCEYERRPWLPVFGEDDERRDAVWKLAARALRRGEADSVTVLADTLDGACDIPAPVRATIVTGCPAVRREARRRSMAAVPRPPSSRHLPSATLLVLDARRPDDLVLAAGAGFPVAAVNHDHLTTLASHAFTPARAHPGGHATSARGAGEPVSQLSACAILRRPR